MPARSRRTRRRRWSGSSPRRPPNRSSRSTAWSPPSNFQPAQLAIGEMLMRIQNKLAVVFVAVLAGVASTTLRSQEGEGTGGAARTPSASPEARKFLAPPNQVVAIRAGRLFDARSGRMLANQVIVVRGERVAEVGAGLQVPAGATVLDLGLATVLPGMIDGHVHL